MRLLRGQVFPERTFTPSRSQETRGGNCRFAATTFLILEKLKEYNFLGLQRIRSNLSSAHEEFTNIMLERHAAGKLRRAFTVEEYEAIITRLEAIREGLEKPNFNDIKMLKMYSILSDLESGQKYLVKLGKNDIGRGMNLANEDLLNSERFIPIEKLYPIILTAHLETKHGKRDTLMKRLREMKIANAGRDTVLLFLSLCETCASE